VRNEEACVCSLCLFHCNIFIGFRIIKEMPGLVGSGTPYIRERPLRRTFIFLCTLSILRPACFITFLNIHKHTHSMSVFLNLRGTAAR